MEDYTALVEVLTNINNNLSHISFDISIFCWLFFFMIIAKDMSSKHEVDRLYFPIDSIEKGINGIINKLSTLNDTLRHK